MKLAAVSFTERGSRLNAALAELLPRRGIDCCGYTIERYAKKYDLREVKPSLQEWTGSMFASCDALLFIGAAGIAVRSIAPFIQSKTCDPAVLVMDEKGVFVISLLSGHLGGANELAGTLADLTGAIPVITTATDVNGRFAVDLFARKNGLYITDMDMARQISADVLDEKKIGFYSDFPVIGAAPEELVPWSAEHVFEGTAGISVSLDTGRQPYKQTLTLLPRIVSVGIGCKKGTDTAVIETCAGRALALCGLSWHSVERIASIDLKEREPGLTALAEKYRIPFVTYDAQTLRAVRGDFSESAFVESVAGVGNVCERSAVLASGDGRLIQKKTAADGVTAAIAVRDWSVDFG